MMAISVFFGRCALLLRLGCALPLVSSGQALSAVAQGEQIYLHGKTLSGAPLTATTRRDIRVNGAQFNCVNCHWHSGYGSSEGGTYALPITAPVLFAPRELDRSKIFNKLFKENQNGKFDSRVRSPGMRPAYDDAALARTIRGGIDPVGRVLDPVMPRYNLGDADMTALIAYLKTLSATPDPGVDSQKLHLATIVSDGIDVQQGAPMLDTMQHFVTWGDLQLEGDRQYLNFSPNYFSTWINSYCNWELDVWHLMGPSSTWPAQLATLYVKKPPFAMVSGLVNGVWQTIHDFCEREKVPCLFPNTDLSATVPEPRYLGYFTRGLALEGDVTAHYLTAQAGSVLGNIMQVCEASDAGSAPTKIVKATLAKSRGATLASVSFENTAALVSALDAANVTARRVDTLILWPGAQVPAALTWLADRPTFAKRVYLPSTALDTTLALNAAANDRRLCFSFPFELPSGYHPCALLVRAWMGSRGVAIRYPRLQFDIYFAMAMLQFGMDEIIGTFSRAYFLESVEHLAESNLNPATFPNLSLGPGQGFSSRGAYMVTLTGDKAGAIAAESGWIVP